MNRYDILHELTLEQLAEVLGKYKNCNMCEYQGKSQCKSIIHNEIKCIEGIELWLREGF